TRAALQCLEALLARDAPPVLALRLEAGMGIVCNNVLHERSAFSDAPGAGRRVYRARYCARVGEHMA
ncbi:MAG TPA: taurine catabolism dioxygenase TauD, partial [Burkholderiales bacterium]|nr:taurine catabolism dioxygenase TauD [Burkholderiales bacterium]